MSSEAAAVAAGHRQRGGILVVRNAVWKLRTTVKALNEVLDALRLEKHPDKTFIGRVERGFDFLGYRLSPGRIAAAEATWKRFVDRALRLYEQERRGSPLLGAYMRRWCRWAASGVPGQCAGQPART